AYVFLLMAAWIFLKNRADFNYNKKDACIILAALIIFSLIMFHILNNSMETIKIIMNTAYPGGEVFNGDGYWQYFVSYVPSVFFPIQQINVPLNVVEHSVIIDFFPMPLIISLIVLFKQKTKDKLLFGLLVLYLLFVVFYFVQLPDFLMSVTLRGHMKTSRMFCVMSFISLLMLIRTLSSLREICDKRILIVISLVLSGAMIYLSKLFFADYYVTWMIVALFILYSVIFSSIFLAHDDNGKIVFLICAIVISLMAGGLVNPIDQGTDVLYDNDFINEVNMIVQENPDDIWLSHDIPINYLTIAGAKTVNSINVYPDLDKWHQFDENGENEDIYNRYAHVLVDFKNDSTTDFTLISTDVFLVSFNVNELYKLNVSYIATTKDMQDFNNENLTFEECYADGAYKIYKVNYLK
ncbi:MAG: hypothetical protein IJ104_03635, partial [Methanobrevibacter sp.]|nr:hypothetical protein [Methanobrevibacter sp.]